METCLSPERVGLTPLQLQRVFPYHVAVNEAFEITQLGNKLMEICDHETVIGAYIYDIFDIVSPSNCGWEWFEIISSKDFIFNITLKPSFLSHLKRSDIKTLNLKGEILLQHHKRQTDSDATLLSSSNGAVFLFHLNISSVDELKGSGFNLHDITDCSLQKEYILKGSIFKKTHFSSSL